MAECKNNLALVQRGLEGVSPPTPPPKVFRGQTDNRWFILRNLQGGQCRYSRDPVGCGTEMDDESSADEYATYKYVRRREAVQAVGQSGSSTTPLLKTVDFKLTDAPTVAHTDYDSWPEAFKALIRPTGCMFSTYMSTYSQLIDVPLMNPGSPLNPSKLYEFQIEALTRIKKAIDGTMTPEELDKTSCTAAEQAAVAALSARRAKEPEQIASPPVAETCLRLTYTPRNFRVKMPCGSGKTLMLIWCALLFGHNTLILTNSLENTIQLVTYILDNTSIASMFDVQFVRSRDGPSSSQVKGSHDNRIAELMAQHSSDWSGDCSNETQRHILPHGGVNGLLVCDINTFKERTDPGKETANLRRRLFQAPIDLLLIDEADSSLVQRVRDALVRGVHGEVAAGPTGNLPGASRDRSYVLQYKVGLFMSATWSRGLSDPAGAHYICNIPQIVNVTPAELIVKKLIAEPSINVVKCSIGDDDEWLRSMCDCKLASQNHKGTDLKTLSPSAMRVIEALVNHHAFYCHKIMIYVHHMNEFHALERLFPEALTINGVLTGREEVLTKMKARAEYDAPFVLISTNVCSTGLNIPDLDVVINAVNFGESDRTQMQRGGRSSRTADGKERAWVYELIPHSHPWSPDGTKEWWTVPRLKLLKEDGYEPYVNVWNERDLIPALRGSILNGIDDKAHASVHNAQLLYDNTLVKLVHVFSFFRASYNDPSVWCDCKSATKEPVQPAKRPKKQQSNKQLLLARIVKAQSKHTPQALPLAKPQKAPSSAASGTSKRKQPAGPVSEPEGPPTYFRQRFFSPSNHSLFSILRPVLEQETGKDFGDPADTWTFLVSITQDFITRAHDREGQRAKTRISLLLGDSIKSLCSFPDQPKQE